MKNLLFPLALCITLVSCAHKEPERKTASEPLAAVGGPGVSKIEKRGMKCSNRDYKAEVELTAETDDQGELVKISAVAVVKATTQKGRNKIGARPLEHEFELEYENAAHGSFFPSKGEDPKNAMSLFDDVHESYEVMIKINGRSVSFKEDDGATCRDRNSTVKAAPIYKFW